jgi:hypothetical protein
MSRVIGPLLSLGASGTIGGAITFSNWKGINTARIKSNPSNPQTNTQMNGRAKFAVAGKISKVTDPTTAVATYVRTVTPAQQSYASYFSRELLGTNNVNIDASIAGYELAGNAAVAAFFNDAAAQAGVEAVDLDGTANTQFSAGQALWAAYTAANRIGVASATVIVTALTEQQVFTFTGALTGVTPT